MLFVAQYFLRRFGVIYERRFKDIKNRYEIDWIVYIILKHVIEPRDRQTDTERDRAN